VGAAEDARRFRALDQQFEGAMARALIAAPRLSVLVSGGVDSTVVALAVRAQRSAELVVLRVGRGADAERAREAFSLLGLDVIIAERNDDDVRAALEEDGGSLASLREPARSVQVAAALAIMACPAGRVLVGQGADELFGGYAHFRGLDGPTLEARRSEDLRRLLEEDWPLSRRIASRTGHELVSPFLEPGFLDLARSIPLEPVGWGGLTKPLFRRWAAHRGVPEEIANAPKRAMQYGSGVASAVRRCLRDGPARTSDPED
jgi:asparagine synthase (glutamine-hydrolysing)